MKKFVAALFVLSLAGALAAQDLGALGNRFFRVSITQNEKPLLAGAMFEDTEGHFIVKGASLASLIARAHGVQPHQIVDAPEWVYQTHLYDVEAEPPPAELVVSDTTRMLQTLLSDSFKLQMRNEMRSVSMLVLDRDQARQLQLARETDCSEDAPRGADAARRAREVPLRNGASLQAMRFARCISTQALINGLERQVGESIHDLTGTEEVYLGAAVGVLPTEDKDPLAAASTSLAHSGLHLERRTVEIDVIVVTAVERPVLDAIDR